MSTNFYIQLKEPEVSEVPLSQVAGWEYEGRLAEPDAPVKLADRRRAHLAKFSWGNLPTFQASKPGDGRYRIASMADVRACMATGLYEIVDEDGGLWAMDAFEGHARGWAGYMRSRGYEGEIGDGDGAPSMPVYEDAEGFRFTCAEFS